MGVFCIIGLIYRPRKRQRIQVCRLRFRKKRRQKVVRYWYPGWYPSFQLYARLTWARLTGSIGSDPSDWAKPNIPDPARHRVSQPAPAILLRRVENRILRLNCLRRKWNQFESPALREGVTMCSICRTESPITELSLCFIPSVYSRFYPLGEF